MLSDKVPAVRLANDTIEVNPMPGPSRLPQDLEEAIRFHGHHCPGLSIGYRASKIALERLGTERAADEELIAIVENDSCSADGVQSVTGCTFGKGNFFFKDHGKQVFTFALRPSGRAIRLALRPAEQRPTVPDGDRAAAITQMLDAPEDALFDIAELTIELPGRASIHPSVACAACGEPTMATRIREVDGRSLCIPCAERETEGATP